MVYSHFLGNLIAIPRKLPLDILPNRGFNKWCDYSLDKTIDCERGSIVTDTFSPAAAQASASRVSVDQLGYYPNDPAKIAYAFGTTAGTFYLKNTSNVTVYTGSNSIRTDFSDVRVCDFTSFTTPGRYYIQCDSTNSFTFTIGDNIYDEAFGKALRYFTYQREGNTELNIEGRPTFLDDGKRADNGAHLDVVGGWNDACDYRRWTYSLGIGLITLSQINNRFNLGLDILNYNAVGANGISDLLDEAKWGAGYFIKMIDPTTGMLYPYCGADDTDYLSDGILYNTDDRTIVVTRNPSDPQQKLYIQYEAMAGLAILAKDYYSIDLAYATTLKDKAVALWNYINSVEGPSDSVQGEQPWSFKLWGCANMYKLGVTFGFSQSLLDQYSARAISTAASLLSLQQTTFGGGQTSIRGYFNADVGYDGTKANIQSFAGTITLLALIHLYELFPTHANAPGWKNALVMYINEFAKPFADRNPYGYIPTLVTYTAPTYYTRQFGTSSLRYRYFQTNTDSWYVGNMGGLLNKAAAFLHAADSTALALDTITKNNCKKMASQIVHIVHGANPEAKSFIRDVGQAQTGYYPYGPRPNLDIPGALTGGNVGDSNDNPTLVNDYNSQEYWTLYNSFYLWSVMNYRKIGFNSGSANDLSPVVQNAPLVSDRSVTVQFNPKLNASYYKIKYGTTSGNYPNTTYTQRSPGAIKNLAYNTYYFAVSAVCGGVETANSNEQSATFGALVTDELNDFSKMYKHSANLGFDTTNTSYFNNDTSRLYKTVSAKQYVIYTAARDLAGFEVDAYFWPGETVVHNNFYTSPDDVTYTAYTPTITLWGGDWLRYKYTGASLPTGTRYVKIEIANTSAHNWNPEISRVLVFGLAAGQRLSEPASVPSPAGQSVPRRWFLTE
jgi:hypothetical protein